MHPQTSISIRHQIARFLLLSIICIGASGITLHAGGWAQPKKGLFTKLYYLSSTAASYNEPDGTEVVSFQDSVKTIRKYATSFSGQGIALYAEYGLLDNLTLTLDLPFSGFSLEETYSIDADHFDYEIRRKLSVAQASWTGFGARWQPLSSDHFAGSLVGLVRIPPGFSSPDTGRADYPFLSDGTLQLMAGVEFGYSFSNGWFETEARYNSRGGDFKDEVLLHLEAGFSNIPRTYLKVYADGVFSTHNFNDVLPFNVIQSQLQETTYNFGGSFMAFITDKWFLEASYSVRVYGYNSWNINTLTLGGGLKIPGVE